MEDRVPENQDFVEYDYTEWIREVGDIKIDWQQFRGVEIEHGTHKSGNVIEIIQSKDANVYVMIKFPGNNEPKKFRSDFLGHNTKFRVKSGSYLDIVTEKIRRRKVQEEKGRRRASELLEANNRAAAILEEERIRREQQNRDRLEAEEQRVRDAQIEQILHRINRKMGLSDEHKEMIGRLGIQEQAALAYEKSYYADRNPAWASAASGWWRAIGCWDRAFEITSDSILTGGKESKQVWTSRAAACWDLQYRDEARVAINHAIRLGTDKYTQNTLLRINSALGIDEDLEFNVKRAEELGSSPSTIRESLRQGFESPAESDEQHEGRKRMAARLLQIDPIRFGWAEKYTL